MKTTLGIAFVLGASLVGCATDAPQAPSADDLAGEQGDGEAAKADSTYDLFGMYTAVKVGKFECNGQGSCTHVTIARANRTSTTCADGSSAASCDVRYLDFSKSGLSSSQIDAVSAALSASADDGVARLVVRGKYVHGTNPIYPNVDWVTFQVGEVWQAQMDDGSLDGTFVFLHDNGRRCFEPPCEGLYEGRLNSVRYANIDNLEWPDAYNKEITSPGWLPNRVTDAMMGTDAPGAIVVGYRDHGTIMHLPTIERTVSQVFLLVK